ncbi:mucin-2 [Drosophila subobscura]|uniref:mucin-2 n=1 Tax=Drosophila subobscura TaxID=7241 RepID=UPI00155A536B|nr:mucin-2 [Drosophila subobscura]
MQVNTINLLTWLLLVVALVWSWQFDGAVAMPQVEQRHETCDNERRYENQVMCEGKAFGALVPYPDNCGLFLVCDCLYPTVKQCPAELWWDNSTQICNYPQSVNCVYYTIETPEPTDGTTRITPGIITELTTLSTPRVTAQPTTLSTPKVTKNPTTLSTTKVTDVPCITPTTLPPTSSWDPPPPPPGTPDDFCRPYPDGSVHRYPYDCQAYINCTHGWPVLNYCIQDKVFNEWLLICDTPDTTECEELPLPTVKPTETVPTTTTTEISPTSTTTELDPTSTTEADDVECGPTPEFVDEDYCQPLGNGFYEYPYNCSAYLSCRNGCTDLDYCISDKLFNSWLHICDTPDSVHCDPLPYPTVPPTSTTPASTTTSVDVSTTDGTTATTESATSTTQGLPSDVNPNDCNGLPDGSRLPYAGNCSQFLLCKDNRVEMGQCPPSTLFNPDFLICDEADDVLCYGDRTTTPIPTTTTTEATTPTPTTTTTKATTLGPAELCAGQDVGTSYPYPEDCSQYYLCLGGSQWVLAPCIYGSYFDPKTMNCGPNVSPTACQEGEATTAATTTTEKITTPTPTTEKPSTTPVATTTTTQEPSGGICGDRDEGENIAYPKDCNKYIVCVSPIPIAFYCPAGSYFSSKFQNCASWEDSDCDQDASTTTASPGITQPPLEPTICTNSSRDTFPYPDNCQWFIRCVDDYIYMMDVCNCGEYYDPISGKCGADVPSDACRWDYTSTTTTTSEPTTSTAVTRPPPQKNPCDNVADGVLVPYPNDCSKYIKCDRPIATAFDCDEGDEFSVELGKCVDAAIAGCSVTTTVNPWGSTTPTIPSTKTTTGDSSTDSSTESSTESSTDSSTESSTDSSTVSSTDASTESSTDSSTDSSTASSTVSITTPEPDSTSTAPGTTTTDSPTTPKPSGGVCEGKTDDSLVPYPNNCSKYIMCQYPIPVAFDCDDGLEFSPTELQCMNPDLANCSPKVTTPAIPTSTTKEPSTTGSTTESTTKEPPTGSTTTAPTTTEPSTTESTTKEPSTTESTSTEPSTTESTTKEPSTTEPTTESTTKEPSTTESTSTEPSTTESMTKEPSTTEATTESTTTAPATKEPSTTESTTTEPSSTVSTTESTTTESTTTESATTEPSTTESTTREPSTTESTTTEPSTTESTTKEPTTTESTTSEPSSTESTTHEPSSTAKEPTTLDPYTPNICCGHPLGTLLPYPNDCMRYVVCDYPIPYAVDCDGGTFFNESLLQCTAMPTESCIYKRR